MMNSHKPLQKLRVFVAFPSDVATERARLGTVIEELKPFAEMVGVALELLDWQGVIPDLGNAEDVILEQLKPTTWDVFIGILWHRFGSPTKRTDPQSGKPYLSGTEQEFRIAYRLWQRYKRPRMMFFWCKAAIPPDTLDLEQYRLVKDFFAGFAPGADHPGLYQTYENAAAFEPLVRRSLTNYLIQYAEQVKGRTLSTQEVESFAPRAHDSLPRRAPFFGRRNETATALRALSPDDRGWGLVIDGIGGIGKTALAVEVAYLCKERGLFDTFVFATAKTLRLEPSGIKDQALAETTLDGLISEAARVLGHANIVDLAGGEPKQRALMAALHGKRTLLIFDNLESLNITEQNRIGDFLRYLPDGSKAIVTSRRRPGESAVILHLEPLTWDEARELIADQVARNPNVQIAFAKVGETAWKQLYDEAGGSPLAMVWTIGLIQSKRLSFGRALAMVRDGSMANALTAFIYRESRKTMDVHEWSVLSALSLFEGPATFDALAAISHLERRPLDSVLSRLNALSLVDTDGVDGASGEERYTMHPMTRRFARTEMALDAQSAHATGLRFARYWAEYAQRFGGDQADGHTAHHQLESEWPNLDGALNWLWQTAGLKGDVAEDKAAARLMTHSAAALEPYLWRSGRWDQLVELCARAYAAARALNDWSGAGWRALDVAWIAYERGQTDEAAQWTDRSMEVWKRGGNKREQAEATRLRALITGQRQNYDEAVTLLQSVLANDREFGNQPDVAADLHDLGELAFNRREYEKAHKYYCEGLDIAQRSEDKESQADHMSKLGKLAIAHEQWPEAQTWYEHALALAREVGRQDAIAENLAGLARVWAKQKRTDIALPMAQEALAIHERLQHRHLPATRELVQSLKTKRA